MIIETDHFALGKQRLVMPGFLRRAAFTVDIDNDIFHFHPLSPFLFANQFLDPNGPLCQQREAAGEQGKGRVACLCQGRMFFIKSFIAYSLSLHIRFPYPNRVCAL